ncbi:MAG TPA: hypothetical protein VFO38_00790 [Candidatus Saccharimonadales bacterium]|nr:hypothetical protein [Candidatus Saccharimonadales bacterium]
MAEVQIKVTVPQLVGGSLAVASLLGWGLGNTLQHGVAVAGIVLLLLQLVVCVGLHQGGTCLHKLVPPSLAIGAVPMAGALWGLGVNWQIAVGVVIAMLMTSVASGALESKQPVGPSVEQID